ncbi:MAG: hypothetical protein GY754_05450, partial [bacterium]|nr:hypothetical protein [bacterium]
MENETDIKNRVSENRSKFHTYNQAKTTSLLSVLSEAGKMLFDFIPFLLDTNIPEMPGYIESETLPRGIYGYTPPTKLLPSIRVGNAPFIYRKDSTTIPFIEMFALMGSGGTIAFTDSSDLDYWVCCNIDSVAPEDLMLFKTKCRMIEEWAAEKYNREVHFFLNDIKSVRNNIFDDDDEYLAGASLGQLLKEEFFRSSIVVNGKLPFWWMVPADCTDESYASWLSVTNESSMAEEFIDLGNLHTIDRDEYMIAGIFQILKSLGNPFKSIIKLGLLERYINSSSGNPFISNHIKKNVQEGKNDPESIDAYIIMFNTVYNYYQSVLKDNVAVNLITKSFYLKLNPRLSEHSTGSPEDSSPKITILKEYTKKWGWSKPDIKEMDTFEEWDIETVNKLLNTSKKYILKGYNQILSNTGTGNSSKELPEEIISGIRKQIFSHFKPASNKIDNTLSFKSYPPEKILTLEFVRDKAGNELWHLVKSVLYSKASASARVIIRKESSLFAMIVWISINGLFQQDFSRLKMDSGMHNIDPNFIRNLITELSLHFTFKRLELHNNFFLNPAFPIINYIVINPYSKYSKKIDDIFLLYHDSWGETKFEVYKNEVDIALILTKIINSGLITKLDTESALRITSSHPYHATKSYSRLRFLVKDIYSFFVDQRSNERKKYITMLGNRYYLFTNNR